MSQITSRKRKGDHLDNGQPVSATNRGYLSISMLDNLHSVASSSVVASEPAATSYIHYRSVSAGHHATHHTANSTVLYGAPNGPLFQLESQNSNPHAVPNKLLILNSNTNSSSGSGVDESSRSEFGVSIDNLSDMVVHANGCQRKQRHETSLGQLTKKFVGLLQDKQGELNLNDASTILQVQKRRIYDITNVLEGVGLLSKTFKNKIKWVGAPLSAQLAAAGGSTNSSTTGGQADKQPLSLNNFNKILNAPASRGEDSKASLRRELDALDAKEKEIDRKIRLALSDLNQLTENEENKKYAFLSYLDIKTINEFSNQTVVAIKAPSETKLELADPREKLQMTLKSDKGEIEVYICPEEQTQMNHSSSCYDLKSQDDLGKGESITSEMDTQPPKQGQKNIDHLKYAFISEDDDLGPMGNRGLLMQTDDQASQLAFAKLSSNNFNTTNINHSPASNSSINDIPFLQLQPPLSEDDYNFALEDSEGIVDLFDEII